LQSSPPPPVVAEQRHHTSTCTRRRRTDDRAKVAPRSRSRKACRLHGQVIMRRHRFPQQPGRAHQFGPFIFSPSPADRSWSGSSTRCGDLEVRRGPRRGLHRPGDRHRDRGVTSCSRRTSSLGTVDVSAHVRPRDQVALAFRILPATSPCFTAVRRAGTRPRQHLRAFAEGGPRRRSRQSGSGPSTSSRRTKFVTRIATGQTLNLWLAIARRAGAVPRSC